MRYSKWLLTVVFLVLIGLAAWDGWNADTVQAEPANLTPIPEPATPTPVHPTHTPTRNATHTPLPEPTHTPLHTPRPRAPLSPPTPRRHHPAAHSHARSSRVGNRASVSTFGACQDGRPLFNILNSGLAIREPRPFWFLNIAGDTASCRRTLPTLPTSSILAYSSWGGQNVQPGGSRWHWLKDAAAHLCAPVGF